MSRRSRRMRVAQPQSAHNDYTLEYQDLGTCKCSDQGVSHWTEQAGGMTLIKACGNEEHGTTVCSTDAEDLLDFMLYQEGLVTRSVYTDTLQYGLSPHSRCTLVEWILLQAGNLQLAPGTVHLAVDLLDRYLSVAAVQWGCHRLAGAACLWIASKYEEVHAKESEHYCCALLINTYTKQQLVAMESHILAALDYRLALPTPWTLLHHFLQASGAACNSHPGTHKQLGSLASYMLELSLLCHDMMAVRPSLRAAASMYLALKMLGCRESWGQQLAQLSRYTQQQVEEQAVALAFMHACNERDGGFTASRDSYAAGSRLHVASIAPCLELAVQHDQAVQWWVEGAARLMPWTGTLQPLQQTSDPIQAAAARWEWTAQYTPWGSMPHTPGQQQQQQDWMTQGARSDGTAHTHGQLQQWAAQCNAPCSSTDSGSVLSAEQPAGCTWLYMPGPAALPAPGPSDSGWMAGSSPPSGVLSAAWQTPNNDSQAVGQSDWRCAQSSWGGTLCASSQPHWGWAAASAGLPWTVGWSAGHPWTGWQLFESAPAAPSTGRHSSFTGFVCTAG